MNAIVNVERAHSQILSQKHQNFTWIHDKYHDKGPLNKMKPELVE